MVKPVKLQIIDLLASHAGELFAHSDAVVRGGIGIEVSLGQIDNVVYNRFGHVSKGALRRLRDSVAFVDTAHYLQLGRIQIRI